MNNSTLQYAEFDRLRAEFETHQEQQFELMDQFQPSVIQNNLKVAILVAEEESESVVENFMESKSIVLFVIFRHCTCTQSCYKRCVVLLKKRRESSGQKYFAQMCSD